MVGAIILLASSVLPLKCRIDEDPRIATSADGNVNIVAEYDGKISIYRKKAGYAVTTTRWSRFGHHFNLETNQDGSVFAIFDVYGGMEVFSGRGKRLAFLTPSNVLTKEEIKNIPGKWACHIEGTWLVGPKLLFQKDRLTFSIYNGRKIHIALPG